jgi:peptidyl-prolyl cis-trans isomerase C
MTHPTEHIRATPAASAGVAVKLAGAAMLVLTMSRPVLADEKPTATPPSQPAKPLPPLAANPAEMMAAMAHELDKNPDQGVMVLETITITQSEMADVIREMPVAMASLGFSEVSRRALDILINQKAMVLNALKEGLDKDPAVIRRTKALRDRALADAWLNKVAATTITDDALHARYDRDIAGKPGPYEVRARLIVVPTLDEARMIIEKAQNGGDFAELARTYSKDVTAPNGGDLGYASENAVSPEIGTAMFALNLGQVTPFPMKSPAGYFVLRVEGRRQRGTPTFEEARPQLEAALRAEAVNETIKNVMAHIRMAPVAKASEPAKK